MRLSDVFRFCSNAHGPSPDTKASAAAPAATQRSFLLAVPPAADEVPAPEHARVCSLRLLATSLAARTLQTAWPAFVPRCSEPPLPWAGGLGWLQLSTEQRLEPLDLLAGECCSPPWMGFALWDGGSGSGELSGCPAGQEGGPLPGGPSPGCRSQARRMQSRQGPDPVPSTRTAAALAALPPADEASCSGGWSRLLVPLCLLALDQSLFSRFNLLLSAQYLTVEQLSGILGGLHAPAASLLGCAPPAPSSSGCAAPPPPLPPLSSPSVPAEVCAPVPSLRSCALPGR